MGYYTSHALTWKMYDGPLSAEAVATMAAIPDVDEFVSEWIAGNEEANYALKPDGSTQQSTKWYDSETDLRELSALVPGVLFTLEGEGEDSADLWKHYYLGGKSQHCPAILTFPPFNVEAMA